MTPILQYLQSGLLLEDKNKARRIRIRAARYLILNNKLYRRSYSQPLLKCLAPEESQYVLAEIHEGIYGNHNGGRTIAHRALSQGYYWPSMLKQAKEYVQKCDKCQRFAPY